MALEDDFPQDPTKPSLQYAVTTHLPLVLPWNAEMVAIGSPFVKEAIAQGSGAGAGGSRKFEFGSIPAFSPQSLRDSVLVFSETCTGTFNDASVTGSSTSHEALNVDFSGSIGGKLLGGSARGQFNKNANQDQGTSKASVHSTFRAGKVTFAEFPRLSDDALRLLQAPDEPYRRFSEQFGDYFVAGYILGGSNSTIAWNQGASVSAAERLDASFEVHALFVSYEDSVHTASAMSTSLAEANLAAFDSLENWHTNLSARDFGACRAALEASRDNRCRGHTVQNRARGKLKELGLGASGDIVPWGRCAEMFEKGLVLELLLLPWDGLREYHSARR